MVQVSNTQVQHKRRKYALQEGGSQSDFVAQLSARKLAEHLGHYLEGRKREEERGLLLYEPRAETLLELAHCGVQFDQVPVEMIEQAPSRLMSILPGDKYTLILSNLAFDWVDAGQYIQVLDHLLKPEGVFWFSAYGPETASRTRSFFAQSDQYPHFNEFYDLHDSGDALLGSGFRDVVLDSSLMKLEYSSVDVLLADAQRVFGVNMNPGRRKTLTPPGVLNAFKKSVADSIGRDGKFSEQLELLVAHGRKAQVPGIRGRIPVREG